MHGTPGALFQIAVEAKRLADHNELRIIVTHLPGIGSSNPHLEFPRLLDLWRAGRLDLENMVSAVRPLTEIPDAFRDMLAGHGLRTVVDLSK